MAEADLQRETREAVQADQTARDVAAVGEEEAGEEAGSAEEEKKVGLRGKADCSLVLKHCIS